MLKKIFVSTLLLVGVFSLTGCSMTKVGEVNDVKKAIQVMNTEVDEYLLSVNLNYSDEEKTITGTFYSNVNTLENENNFKGVINYNSDNYETYGYFNDKYYILEDLDKNNVKINKGIINIKDLKFTDIVPIDNRAGEENLNYYNVTINNKYEGRIGIGKADNVIYTISIDFRDTIKDKLVSVYEVNVEISDTEKDIPEPLNKKYTYEVNSILDVLNNGGE